MSIFSDHECGAMDDDEFRDACRRLNRMDRYEREHEFDEVMEEDDEEEEEEEEGERMTREEAIGCLQGIVDTNKMLNDMGVNSDVPIDDEDIQALEMAISALSESDNKGEWIDVDGVWFRCSRCDAHRKMIMLGGLKENYCPNCGADMRGE